MMTAMTLQLCCNGFYLWLFRKHEWTKHGTCAAKAEVLDTQRKYFGKSLELYHKLDLDGWVKLCNSKTQGFIIRLLL